MQALWNNPLFYKFRLLERREYKRSKSSFWLKQMGLVWCVVIPLCWSALMTFPEFLEAFSPRFSAVRLSNALGHLLEYSLAALILSYFVVLVVAIGIALSGTTNLVTGERANKTFESLQSTMLTPVEIVNGRLMSGLWPVLRELLIVAPVALFLGASASYGAEAFLCVCLLFSTVAFYGAVGLWSSYRTKNTQNANRLAAGVAGSLLVGVPLAAALFQAPELLKFHPVFAAKFLGSEGFAPVILVTSFHFCGAALLWLDSLRQERSAVRI